MLYKIRCTAYVTVDGFLLQKKKLQALYEHKVRSLVQKLLILEGDSERCVKLLVKLMVIYWNCI